MRLSKTFFPAGKPHTHKIQRPLQERTNGSCQDHRSPHQKPLHKTVEARAAAVSTMKTSSSRCASSSTADAHSIAEIPPSSNPPPSSSSLIELPSFRPQWIPEGQRTTRF
ncbi:hypothetical protein BJ508DRAFT_177005 [Ascobolus immersus RN42]|uniref:Uncharacterized protein n=1 Tax=Ascobolus immersus RN42 TaxID=1160509 RepID=A0A3N4IH58_ASCIM|nr:hypothetical protein BJ508DRAFT_177005 [Ascobolus immersus RN42]